MTKKLKVALIQINAGNDKTANLNKIKNYIEEAAKNDAKLICLPEVANFRGSKEESISASESLNDGLTIQLIKKLAKENQVAILLGSFFQVAAEADSLPFNTSILVNETGEISASYQKTHLFDVVVGNMEIKESSKSQSGCTTALVDCQGFLMGLSICYDLRFPEFYRVYAKKKVDIICVPSAFTKTTGEAHWQTLLRARAIENQCYIIAPNQCGTHAGIESYGHSLIVDPWGNILAEASGDKEEIVYAELDKAFIEKIRKNFPALEHARFLTKLEDF